MPIPTTTPGRLGRVRTWIAALLMTAAAGALGAASAQAAPPPDPPRTYKVAATLDGRYTPRFNDVMVEDYLQKGQRVAIECQAYGDWAYGSKLWDLVNPAKGATLFVPDRFVKTGYSGRAPDIRPCTREEKELG
jgi:hypothetical protein